MEEKDKEQPKKEGEPEVKEVKIGILSKKDHKKKKQKISKLGHQKYRRE